MPWFNPAESYNPAVHRTKQAMFHCAIVSDLSDSPLPPPHPELLKYFDPPERLLKRARPAIVAAQEAFKVKEVPKRVPKRGPAAADNKGHEYADDDDDMLLLDRKRPNVAESTMMDVVKPEPISPSKDKGKAKDIDSDGSETEDDEEAGFVAARHPGDGKEGFLLDRQKPPLATPEPSPQRGAALPTPARSLSPQIDLGRAPGRIIGTTFPLRDFEKNLEQGDVVTKAVEDLCQVIMEIVIKPFASKRHQEMVDCLRVLRDTCLKVRNSS
jgi:ATP-dependent DNA helicase 2 subunit 2